MSKRRPSPAMIIAMIALCLGLGGSAIAASDLSKSQVKKIAKKQAKKQIRQKAAGLRVAHAETANSATTAGFATTAGKAGTVLQSAGGPVSSPAGTGFFVANALALPPGSYLVFARAGIDNDDPANDQDVTCRLVVGTQTDEQVDLLELDGNDDTDSIALMVPETLGAAGGAAFECDNPGGGAADTEVDSSRIVALPINAIG